MCKCTITWVAVVVGLVYSTNWASAQTKTVSNSEQANAALAAAAPGQTIVFADGDYDLQRIEISCAATEEQPLIIRAQNVGKARLIGTTVFALSRSSYVTLEGFRFESDDNAVVHILGSH